MVEGKVTRQRRPRLPNTVAGPQIGLFVLHRPPKAVNINVIPQGTTAIQAHGNRVLQQQPGEGRACELHALILSKTSGRPDRVSASPTASRQSSKRNITLTGTVGVIKFFA